MTRTSKKYLIAVGGFACKQLQAKADVLINDHFLFGATPSSLAYKPDAARLGRLVDNIPIPRTIEIATSLQGRFSLECLPKLLLALRDKGRSCNLRILPVPSEIAEYLRLPTIAVERPEQPYQIAISYASEDIAVAEELASKLVSRGLHVFFDQFESSRLWGKNLYQHLYRVFADHAHYCVIIISASYIAAQKRWTRHELAAAQDRQLR